MVSYYFKLQLTLLNRKLKAFGLPPAIGLICIPILFIALSFLMFSRIPFCEYIYPAIATLLIHHNNHRDKDKFLQFNCTKSDYRIIRVIEQLCIGLPFVLFLVFKEQLVLAAILLVLSIVLSLLKISIGPQSHMPTPFSKIPFEFTVGFRRSIAIILGSYFILLMALRVNNYNLGLFTLVLAYFICLGYYYMVEPGYYVSIFNDTPRTFLKRKMKAGLLYSNQSALPIALILILVYPQHYLPVLLVVGLGTLLILITIMTKYSSFPDSMTVGDSILLAVSLVFPPLLLFTLPKLYHKSIDHLKHLLP